MGEIICSMPMLKRRLLVIDSFFVLNIFNNCFL